MSGILETSEATANTVDPVKGSGDASVATSAESEPSEGGAPSVDAGAASADEALAPSASADGSSGVSSRNVVVVRINYKGVEPYTLEFSPSVVVHDIVLSVSSSAATLHISHFELHNAAGESLGLLEPLSSFQWDEGVNDLYVHEIPYDDLHARIHVRRIRDMIAQPGPFYSCPSNSTGATVLTSLGDLPSALGKPDDEITDDTDLELLPSLATLYPTRDSSKRRPALEAIRFSGWNPPPSHLRLGGELFYLQVVTLEHRTLHITACTRGFYVNNTTRENFNPSRCTTYPVCHSLVTLLERVSPEFRKEFARAREANEPIPEVQQQIAPSVGVLPWAGYAAEHVFDWSRAEDSSRTGGDFVFAGQLREWNDEYQMQRGVPAETSEQRLARDIAISRFYSEFVEAALHGARTMVDNELPPLDTSEDPNDHMYMYNNILLTTPAHPNPPTAAGFLAENPMWDASLNDLEAVGAVMGAGVTSVRTVPTAVFDYKGRRIVAQAIVPGVFSNTESDPILYGSIDFGEHVAPSDAGIHQAMQELGEKLMLATRTVTDASGATTTQVCGSYECKGIMGSDRRYYVVDLYRMQPRDPNLAHLGNDMALFPRKLLMQYVGTQVVRERKAKAKAKADAKADAEAETETKADAEAETETKAASAEGETEQEQELEAAKIRFNVNLDTKVSFADDEAAAIEADRALVADVARFLTEEVIPGMVHDITVTAAPVDGQVLRSAMSERGISPFYLGHIADLFEEQGFPHLVKVARLEMIAECVVHYANYILREVAPADTCASIAHLLNCFLSDPGVDMSVAAREAAKEAKKAGKADGADAGAGDGDGDGAGAGAGAKADEDQVGYRYVTTRQLWSLVAERCRTHFGYTGKVGRKQGWYGRHKLAALRAFCLKSGIQVAAKAYVFSKSRVFAPADIIGVNPVAHTTPVSTYEGQLQLKAGREMLSRGYAIHAIPLLAKALTTLQNVHTLFHKDVASASYSLALAHFETGNIRDAVMMMKRAVIINERVTGLDSINTATSYRLLGKLFAAANQPLDALVYQLRARYLLDLAVGAATGEHVAINTTIGALLTHPFQRPRLAGAYYAEAMASLEDMSKTGVAISTGLLELQKLLVQNKVTLGDFDAAVQQQQKFIAFVKEMLGDRAEEALADEYQTLNALVEHAVKQRTTVNALHQVMGGDHAAGAPALQAPSSATQAAASSNGTQDGQNAKKAGKKGGKKKGGKKKGGKKKRK